MTDETQTHGLSRREVLALRLVRQVSATTNRFFFVDVRLFLAQIVLLGPIEGFRSWRQMLKRCEEAVSRERREPMPHTRAYAYVPMWWKIYFWAPIGLILLVHVVLAWANDAPLLFVANVVRNFYLVWMCIEFRDHAWRVFNRMGRPLPTKMRAIGVLANTGAVILALYTLGNIWTTFKIMLDMF